VAQADDDADDDFYEMYSVRMGNLNALVTTTTEARRPDSTRWGMRGVTASFLTFLLLPHTAFTVHMVPYGSVRVMIARALRIRHPLRSLHRRCK